MKHIFNLIVLLAVLAPSLSVAVQEITVLGLFKNKAIVNVDGKQRVLTVGEPSPEGIVLVSANSEAAVMEVDGVTGTYGLGNHISGTFRQTGGRSGGADMARLVRYCTASSVTSTASR